ncbi:MAG: NPCBM/NEW2 domain-containing protein [Armatimonadota bacterium]|nr:NPCBM/NEW2 domain-containing protein [Armatimonadota bacterium]MDW8024403.1 NPCBM/NEW2 domain-containing protein [Armatimonadota bacterium]
MSVITITNHQRFLLCRLFILACAACFAIAGVAECQPVKTMLYVPRANVKVQIDAMPLEWAMTTPLAIGAREKIHPKSAWDGPEDLSALVRCMWDEGALYALIEVCDNEVVVKDEVNSCDRIKVEIGEFGICLLPAIGKYSARAFDTRTNLQLLEDGTWAASANSNSYLAELCIPWNKLGRLSERAKGKLIMNIEVVDVDLVGDGKILGMVGEDAVVMTIDKRTPNELLADVNVLSGMCLIEVSSSELVPDTELQVDIMLPRTLLGVIGVETTIVDELGNEFEMKLLRRERLSIFWRWRYSWLIPPDARGSYTLKLNLLGADNQVLAAITRSIGSAMRIATLDIRAQIDELVSEARSQTLRARRLGDEVACGRWATLWFHASRLQDDFVGMTNEEPTIDAARAFLARLNELQRMRKNIVSGKDPFDGHTGVIERAYLSSLDDTLQPYSVYIPPIYYNVLSGKRVNLPKQLEQVLAEDEELARALDVESFRVRGFPMVVQLHGLGGTYKISSPSPSSPLWAVIVLAPHGRGPTDYKVWGEVDVVCVIKEAMRTYRVDEDRVYMTGVSMGGTGCWQIATHYPDLFAAIAPICGNADHRVWEREWNWGQPERTFMTDVRNFLENCESPVFLAENLMHVPVYCVHGDADDIVPVGHSRSMVGRLRELGYSVIYDEQKGVGHGGFHAGTFDKLYAWLLKQVRNRYPKRVVYKTGWLKYKGAYWVEINRIERYLNFAAVDAEIVSPNAISVRTNNVAHFTLRLNDNIVDTSKPVSVSIDGEFVYRGGVSGDGSLSFVRRRLPDGAHQWVLSSPPQGLIKSATLEGPIEAAFLSRFIIAYGTVGDDRTEVKVNEAEARKLAAHWARWASGRAIVKRDVDVTDDDVANANLVLIGNLKSNHIIKRINAFLPIRFDASGNTIVMANGLRFEGDDVGVNMVYPNPLNPKRLVVIIGGVTWKGTFDVVRRFDNWFDWGVLDHRKWFDFAIYDARTRDPETFLAVGFYDQDWMLSDELTFYGDAKLRHATPPLSPSDRQWASASEHIVYLSDLKPISFSSDKGPLGIDRTTNGYPLTLGGRQYSKGLSVHPDAEIVYDIGGRFKAFECVVGIDTSGEKPVSAARERAETVTFQVFGDGKLLAEVTDVKWNTPPKRIAVSVEGVRALRLVAKRQGGARWLYGKVDFADAKLVNETIHRHESVGIYAFSRVLEGEEQAALPRSLAEEVELGSGWRMRPASYGEGVERGWHEKPFEKIERRPEHLGEGQFAPDADFKGRLQDDQPDLQRWQVNDNVDWGGIGYRAELEKLELQVNLPMSVHGALIQHGIMQDPCGRIKEQHINFQRTNEQLTLAADEVGEFEWWLQKVFQVPEDWRYRAVLLELSGVSYQADVWVNGKPAGRVCGMWHKRTFDITTLLNFGGENLISIRLTDREVPWTCPPKRIELPKSYEALVPSLFEGEFGGMKLIPISVWQPVKLRTVGICALSDLQVKTVSVSRHEAIVRVAVKATNMHPQKPLVVRLYGQVGGCGFVWAQAIDVQTITLTAGETKDVSWDVRVANPRLWWTCDLSQPSLYQISVTAALDNGIITDELKCVFGIRSVEVAAPQATVKVRGGMLRLNSMKFVQLKGTGWVVPDQLLRLDEERYEMLIGRLVQLGFNCLYVSSATLPESSSFYSLCDRYGIFVIQELPIWAIDLSRIEHNKLLDAVRQLVLRLRNHPSLLMWSLGISEAQEAQVGEFVRELLEMIASLDDERMVVIRLMSGGQNCINPRMTDDTQGVASEPLFLLVEALPQMKYDSNAIECWFKIKSAVEKAICRADGSGFIIGQFNEPRIGTGMALVQYDGKLTPPAYVFARALRSEFTAAFYDDLVYIARSINARSGSDAALQAVVCDMNGAARQSVMPILGVHPGERRVINLSEFGERLSNEYLTAVAIHALGERAPSFVSVYGNTDVIRRLVELDTKAAKQIAVAPAHVKAIWVTRDTSAANRAAFILNAVGAQIKVVPLESVITDCRVLTDALEEVDAVVFDGEALRTIIQAGVDQRIGEALARAIWRGVGLLFNGLPALQLGEAPLSGHLPSLMPATAFCDATGEKVEVSLTVEEEEHPTLRWLSIGGVKIRRDEMRVLTRKGAILLLSDSLGVPILVESSYGKGRVLAWTINIITSDAVVTTTSFSWNAFASTVLYACRASFALMKALSELTQGAEREATEGFARGEGLRFEPPEQVEGEQPFGVKPFGERWGIGAQQYELEEHQQREEVKQQVERWAQPVLVYGVSKGRAGLIYVSIEPEEIEWAEDKLQVVLRIKNGFPFPMPSIVIEGRLDDTDVEVEDNLFDMMPVQERRVQIWSNKIAGNEPKELRVKIKTLIGDVQISIAVRRQNYK